MDQFPMMLYKADGQHEIHGGRFDTLIVADKTELDAAQADGWHLTTDDAVAATIVPAGDTPPTRAELEQKAHELGIEFSPNIGDKKLAERIEAALTAQQG